MKGLFLAVLAVSTYTAAASAQENCMFQAEQHLKVHIDKASYTQPGQWVGFTARNNHIYTVRSNLFGGEAQYEVITTPSCAYIDHRLLWAE